MVNKMVNPCPSVKDSGVPWLGKVPAHWEVSRLKADIANIVEQTSMQENNPFYIALEHVESWNGNILESNAGEISDGKVKKFRARDVLFGKLRPYLAKVTRPEKAGFCVGEFLVLRPKRDNWNSAYLENMLRSKQFIDVVDSSTFGAKMPRAEWQFIGSMHIPAPPLPEQNAIVRYLDCFDRRIRRYIRGKEKLIGLLEERKRVVIHRAVTRGLDKGVRLKSSGVEWLGEVPEHWEVSRLKADIANIVEQASMQENNSFYIALEHVESWNGNILESNAGEISDGKVKKFRAGDVLFGKLRPYLAKVTRPEKAGFCVGEFLVLRPKRDNWNSAYLENMLRSKQFIDVVDSSTFGAKMPRAEWQFIGSMYIPAPPLPEQTAIVQYLDKATAEIDTAIVRARRAIDLLTEYRTRLISDVVTGKLDVREVATSLPSESDISNSPAPMDENNATVDKLAINAKETAI